MQIPPSNAISSLEIIIRHNFKFQSSSNLKNFKFSGILIYNYKKIFKPKNNLIFICLKKNNNNPNQKQSKFTYPTPYSLKPTTSKFSVFPTYNCKKHIPTLKQTHIYTFKSSPKTSIQTPSSNT